MEPAFSEGSVSYGAAGTPGFANGPGPMMQDPRMAPVAEAQQGSFMDGLLERKMFLRGQRRRMNIWPILLCLFLPWIVFSVIHGVSSFSVHYFNPGLYYFILVICLVTVLVCVFLALKSRLKFFSHAEHEPSWILFLAVSMLVAWVAGFLLGGQNFAKNTKRYCDLGNLNSYTDVHPDRMRGQQLMDAGTIQFSSGSHLDLTRSQGFRNNNMYCVVPIVNGVTGPRDTMATYDFWAVGENCCTGWGNSFHCGNSNSAGGNGGLRLLNDGARPFYRLAVQQAEAKYKLKATHPLFFQWVEDPGRLVDEWKANARSEFLLCIFSALAFQAFLVAAAVLAFSRLG
eukprot:CAMPEP_0168405602 /NCGR_PEP_ID=MMETSP0228-20121227/25224_1 /TAXON_ID=133427 /ORGANISM="Protoceratium reticulatum, Strain CCCM 535 (=CCMP 1889)" /LENGTH=341 /DNA_ID=CAMNT_0008419231 /DNA_START=14 /DNA_END=1035 /DNA_ORIENTATION=+